MNYKEIMEYLLFRLKKKILLSEETLVRDGDEIWKITVSINNITDTYNSEIMDIVGEKTCANCRWANPSLFEWIFCREPHRMINFKGDYLKGSVPRGGYPQSLDHYCERWEKKED